MRKLIILAAALSPTALAAPFKIKPATVAAADVEIDRTPLKEIDSFHYSEVEEAYPYIGIKSIKSTITAQAIKDACGLAVRERLKTPGAAKFPNISKPIYFESAGTYLTRGQVDSQNSYGALLRSSFYCFTAFQGTAKGGTLYTHVILLDN